MNALGWTVFAARSNWLLVFAGLLAGCATTSGAERAVHLQVVPLCPAADTCDNQMLTAQKAAIKAQRMPHGADANRGWATCAGMAYEAILLGDEDRLHARSLATRCTDQLLQAALREGVHGWRVGPRRIGGVAMWVQLRDLSPDLQPELELVRAADVPMKIYGGQRHSSTGFGVPLVAHSPRCDNRPACSLLPSEGIFRSATAWIEPGVDGEMPRLVVANPDRTSVPPALGALSVDRSAPYARGAGTTALRRQGVWGLLGGKRVGSRAGVYLLEEYDPNRRPVVMIHGLGSSPLIWARTSNAIWGDPLLRQHFQVWHVVYQTNAPLLVTRRRMKQYLDTAFNALDPEGDDAARQGIVLIGHSMGGVLAKLLSADSGNALWSAAFNVPPDHLQGASADVDVIRETFLFSHYPGINQVIFMAAPHHGSPAADGWLGRLMNRLVGRRVPEMKALARVAKAQPMAVREELRESYQQSRLNSIATLRAAQPVRRVGESLMPHPGVSYHTIAGYLHGEHPPGDGVVPLDSALLPSAASTLVIDSDHYVYQNSKAVDEVVRILSQAATTRP